MPFPHCQADLVSIGFYLFALIKRARLTKSEAGSLFNDNPSKGPYRFLFSFFHSDTGGMIPIAITSSRSLVRCE